MDSTTITTTITTTTTTTTPEINDIETGWGQGSAEIDWDTPSTEEEITETLLTDNPFTNTLPLPPINNITSSVAQMPFGLLSSDILSEITYTGENHPLTPPAGNNFSSLFNTTNTSGNTPDYSPFVFGNNTTNNSNSNITFATNISIPSVSTSTINTGYNLEGFSSEDIEEGVIEEEILEEDDDMPELEGASDTDSDTDTDTDRVRTLLRLRRFQNLRANFFSFGIIWNFENNYDYYKIDRSHFFPECRTTRYLAYKTKIDDFNKYKNMRLGKYWELKKSPLIHDAKYIYYIIYFNNMLGHIDIEYYGIFSEEINEDKTIKQIIEMGIYGTSGRMHIPEMTCTDGVGFNLFKNPISFSGW
jgi:hypothetical protein